MKIILPAIWIPLFGFGVFMIFLGGMNGGPSSKWELLLVWVAGSAFTYWSGAPLKEVSVDDNFLYVSNYFKEISIPLSEIYDVTENKWLNIHPVTIHLKSPSEFGGKIVFMPKVRFAFFGSHPVVNQLKKLASSKSMTTGFMR